MPPPQLPAWQVSPVVQAFRSLQVVVPLGLLVQVPTVPVRLQAMHWLVQAVSQHTPLVQKPDAHWLAVEQARPNDGS
jgi:hypothetical protein